MEGAYETKPRRRRGEINKQVMISIWLSVDISFFTTFVKGDFRKLKNIKKVTKIYRSRIRGLMATVKCPVASMKCLAFEGLAVSCFGNFKSISI